MNIPRPEYPRPDFVRDSFVNLNGEWSFEFDFGRSGPDRRLERSEGFARKILVPFCPESVLSGVGYTDFIDSMFYHRRLTVPVAWSGKQILLHFGGVDYQAEIYLDGQLAGSHSGGSVGFGIDLTRLATPGKEQNLVVRVVDEARSGDQALGKQSTLYHSCSCNYTRVTGIWQTVWMEAVDPAGLASCRIIPDFDAGAFALVPAFYREARGRTLTVEIAAGGETVATAEVPGVSGSPLVLPLPAPRAWSPEDPFLYDITLVVRAADGAELDRVRTYGGLRKIHLEGNRVFLNNEPIYQRLVLDQGFYPDGIWTAPSDEALKRDIELSLAAGFNGARLHQKVFEPRFHYWADRLGYLTWAEYGNWGMDFNRPEGRANYLAEWREIVGRDLNHPSIIAWSPLNETCPPHEKELAVKFAAPGSLARYRRFVAELYDLTKTLDPARPVNDASGYLHVKTDLWTVHPYRPDAASFRAAVRPPDRAVMIHAPSHECEYGGQPYLIDEFGGFKYLPPELRGVEEGWGYHGLRIDTPEELVRLIAEQTGFMADDGDIAGFCYTQLTDVEQEQNGIYNYDRSPKFDPALVAPAFRLRPAWSRL